MKKLLILPLTTLTMLSASWLSGQGLLEQWTFSEPDATVLSATTNSGTGDWNFAANMDAYLAVNGGVLQMTSFDQTADTVNNLFFNTNGSGTDITSVSQFELSFDLPALELTAAGNNNYFGVELLGDANQVIGSFRLTMITGGFKARLNRSNLLDFGVSSVRSLPSADINVTFSIDLSAGTFGQYTVALTGGTGVTPFSSGALDLMVDPGAGLGGVKIAAFANKGTALVKTGTGDYIQLDNLTLTDVTPVPEPSTYAFLTGITALALVIYRRRRA